MALNQEEARRIDIEIAEKVMGWKRSVQPHPELPPITIQDLYDAPGVPMPPYSTDIAAAWEVVEEVVKYNKYTMVFDLQLDTRSRMPERVWFAWFRKDQADQDIEFSGESDTAPHAICLAALKAVESP